MTYAQLLIALLQASGTILPAVEKVITNIKAGQANTTVTDADWAELLRLSGLTSDGIYQALGITPPPKAA